MLLAVKQDAIRDSCRQLLLLFFNFFDVAMILESINVNFFRLLTDQSGWTLPTILCLATVIQTNTPGSLSYVASIHVKRMLRCASNMPSTYLVSPTSMGLFMRCFGNLLNIIQIKKFSQAQGSVKLDKLWHLQIVRYWRKEIYNPSRLIWE